MNPYSIEHELNAAEGRLLTTCIDSFTSRLLLEIDSVGVL